MQLKGGEKGAIQHDAQDGVLFITRAGAAPSRINHHSCSVLSATPLKRLRATKMRLKCFHFSKVPCQFKDGKHATFLPSASRLFLLFFFYFFLCLYTTMFQPLQLDVVTKVTSLVACNLRVRCPETLALFLHSAAHSVRGSRGDSCSPAQQTLRRLIRGLWKNQYCHRDSRKTFSIKFTSLILHFLLIFFCEKK